MHCERGVWSANVTVFGAWGPGLGYTFDYLVAAPPPFSARRSMIERGHPWFSLVELSLPSTERRPMPLTLHVAAITGTVWAPEIEAELLDKADAVVLFAETASYRLDQAREARRTLDDWIARRGDTAVVVFQLDRPYLEDAADSLDLETLRRELAIGDHPVVETNARERQLGGLVRVVVDQLLAARDRLPRRANYSTAP